MAKLSAWLITIIGVLMAASAAGVVIPYNAWLMALLVLVLGVSKLMRNYKK